MTYIAHNNSATNIFDEDELPNELGGETEAEKQMKVVLEKQLCKTLSLQEQFSQHRTFVSPSTYQPLTELIKGSCSFEEFKSLEQHVELHQELQRCGLSDTEIKIYTDFKKGLDPGGGMADPAVRADVLRGIEAKIRAHEEAVARPQGFRNAKRLTRHEMDLERALYAGCPEKRNLSSLVAGPDPDADSHGDELFEHVRKASRDLLKGPRRKKQKPEEEEEKKADFLFDSNIHHVTVPLAETEVVEKRLTVEEIRNLPRFKDYQIGCPSQTLYLKNLHPKTTLPELRALFGRFEEENASPLEYRLCTGRMKGQAFVTFINNAVSEKALHFTNGYVLRGRPVIIQFGRKT